MLPKLLNGTKPFIIEDLVEAYIIQPIPNGWFICEGIRTGVSRTFTDEEHFKLLDNEHVVLIDYFEDEKAAPAERLCSCPIIVLMGGCICGGK